MSNFLYTTCPVCQEEMKHPVLLFCLHSLCEECLKSLLHLPNGKLVQCPLCREKVDFNSETTFPFNFLIEKKLRSENTHQVEPMCDCCCEGSTVVKFCDECQQFLCEFCSTAHKRMSKTKTHELLRVDESLVRVKEKVSILNFCPAHCQVEAALFCQTCQISLCKECVLRSGVHTGHNLTTLQEEIQSFKRQLEDIFLEVNKKEEIVKTASEGVEDMIANIEQQVIKTSKNIQEVFDNLINRLQERRTSLLSDLEVTYKSKLRVLQSQNKTLDSLLHGFRISREFVHQVLKQGSESEILSLKNFIKQRISKFRELQLGKSDLEPKENDKIGFFIDNSSIQWELSVLGSIDKGKSSTQPSLSFAHGQSLHSSTAGQCCTFKITALNVRGQTQHRGGDRVDIVVKSRTDITDEVDYDSAIKDNSNGTYTVTYTVQNPGDFLLDVKINNVSISKSPFYLHVYPLHWVASKFIISGQESGSMKHPSGVHCAQDKIFIADSGNHRIVIKSIKGDEEYVFGCYGSAPGQFSTPHSLALNPKNQLVITDSQNHRVQILTLQGEVFKCFGGFGTKPGKFNHPLGLSVDRQGNIFVADSGNNRIQIFTSEGVPIRQIEMANLGDIVGCPWGIAVSDSAFIAVSDYKKHIVQVFDRSGKLLKRIGGRGTGNGLFNNPAGLCIDTVGRIVVADKSNHRVQIFSANGDYLGMFGCRGEENGFMKFPSDVSVDRTGYFHVVDTFNNRIQVFEIVIQDV